MTTQNGPGKSYRKGLNLVDLARLFPNDASAESWFVQARWPDGVLCVHCSSPQVTTEGSHPTMPYRCLDCRKFFSVKTGTIMQSSKIGYQKWAMAYYILTTGIKGTSSMKLHRDLGVTQKTAWHMAHRIRETWAKQTAPLRRPGRDRRDIHRREGAQQALLQEAQGGPRPRRKVRCGWSEGQGDRPDNGQTYSLHR